MTTPTLAEVEAAIDTLRRLGVAVETSTGETETGEPWHLVWLPETSVQIGTEQPCVWAVD